MDVYKRVEGDGYVVHEMWFGDVAKYVVMEHDKPEDWPMVANTFADAFCARIGQRDHHA